MRVLIMRNMVAAIPDKNIYYNKSEVIQKEGDWERLQLQFEIDSSQAGEMLEMYLFNPKEDWVYFDDFSIKRFVLK
ncbi:MAG: hypothetical protein IPM92_15945 [Saprospiraceae bacterium]|nr:hypothetical protein [Saprospiraceae bacterium]